LYFVFTSAMLQREGLCGPNCKIGVEGGTPGGREHSHVVNRARRMIFSENRYPSRIKSGTGFFGIMRGGEPSGAGIMDARNEPQLSVADVAYDRLRADILGGALLPGMKLKLDALRARYDVSINTLRETLSRLAADGLVEAEGQRGFTVMPASLADLIDITETRRLLECHAAQLSVERADLEWESRLVAAYHKLSRAEELVVQDAEKHADLLETYNRQFHIALISGCNSRWLLHFHGMMYDQSLRYRMLAFRVKDFPRDQSRREHKQILDAALARDVEALVTVLGTHITKGAEMYAEYEAAAQGKGRGKRKSK
jgi:GntR family carbon starvation induced transcriptional regulator